MKFIRRHGQRNLIERDIKTLKPGESTAPIIEDEVFDISHFMIFLSNGSFEFTPEKGISEIIESENFFTIIDKDKGRVLCLKYDKIEKFEFVLSQDTPKLINRKKEVKPKRLRK